MGARRGRRRTQGAAGAAPRQTSYQQLKNPFTPQKVFSDDAAEAIHQAALSVLRDLGMKVLLPEARALYAAAGAIIDHETQMVRLGPEIIEAALAACPRAISMRGGSPDRDVVLELGALTFMPGGGAPNSTNRERGRRPGTLDDFCDLISLNQHFDVLHMLTAVVEPQDIPIHLRHYATLRAQVTLSDKIPFAYARGTPQTEDCFEMLRIARGLDAEKFEAACWCKTVINTNSPRQLDIPMAQGIIDFARAGQLSIITPFCLAGAMAPITLAGALTLQHAEALAGIALAQLARPGAPVTYGSFLSNVDMKSGAPAFGTPEHVKATLASGQLARLIRLPWRSGAGSAANCVDAQAAAETQMGLWASVLAGATIVVHAAGWLEGGLSNSYEKLVTDAEVLQEICEVMGGVPVSEAEIGLDAIAEVAPGGHFFAASQTMERYRTAFYEPLVADLSNHGAWMAAGSKTAEERATDIWRDILASFQPAGIAGDRLEELDDFIRRRTGAGGAPPVS